MRNIGEQTWDAYDTLHSVNIPPLRASPCPNVGLPFHRRNHVVREISVKLAEIQNAGLGEMRLRELNDEINRLLKDKAKWESQIASVSQTFPQNM